MVRPESNAEDKTIETWESVIPGIVFVWTYDRREDRYIQVSVGGKSGSKRLYLTRDDRKYNQEQVPFENSGMDVFTNGALRLIASETRDEHLDTRYHYTNEELAELFEVRDTDLFMEAVQEISSELILRRLMAMGEKLATQAQFNALKELVAVRYPIGGTQKTVREMIEAGERIGR
jgi:hypothetical protein